MLIKRIPPHRLLALLLCVCALLPCSACALHRHSGELTALCTDPDTNIPCCGVFRCKECGETYRASVTARDAGMPVIQIQGDLSGISKTDTVTVKIQYDGDASFTCSAELKWQGESSLLFPKKNYSVKLTDGNGKKKDVLLRDEWGKQSKYCLKANWEDFAGARNLVSAKLWGEIVHSRSTGDRLEGLVNGGAVDGYPVLLYVNGGFQGLYTLNTPKNRWIFGITKNDARAGLLFAEYWRDEVNLQTTIDPNDPPEISGWSVEYCATEDGPEGTGWLFDGMNGLISFLRNSSDETLRENLGTYTNVERVIDYILFASYICGADNLGRNIIWATFDGKKYVPSAYDMDSTWFYNADLPPGADITAEIVEGWISAVRANLLFARVLDVFGEDLKTRCAALRGDLLSAERIQALFSDYMNRVPDYVRAAEAERWPEENVLQNNDPLLLSQRFSDWAAALDTYYIPE